MNCAIKPRKGWVLVEPIEPDIFGPKSEMSFIIPDSSKQSSAYMIGRTNESIIVFPSHMMIEIEYENKIFNLLEEKYIVADIEELKN